MPGMVDLHAHLPQLPNAGVGFALDLLTWLDRVTFPTEQSWSDPAVAERLAPAIFEAFAAAGTTTVLAYGVVYEAAMDVAFRAAEAHGIRAILGKVMMDRGHLRPDRSSRRPSSSGRCASRPTSSGAGTAPTAAGSATRSHHGSRSRARAEMLRESAALAASTGAWWQTHVSRGSGSRSPRSRGSSPTRATTSTSTTAPAASARGPSSPTPSTSPTASSAGWSRPARTSPTVPASNLFIGAGVMPLARYREAGLSIGLGSDVSGGPDASIFSVMRVGAYAQMARRSMVGDEGAILDAARLAPAGHARRGASARARRRDRVARGRQGGRPHRGRPGADRAAPGFAGGRRTRPTS